MNQPPDPLGSGHPLSSGSGHHSQTGRDQLVACKDGSQRHQLDQHRLQALYPVIPAALAGKELCMLHPVRYMPPPGAYYNLHDWYNVRFSHSASRSCGVCMGERHVNRGRPCYETCLACGDIHPTVVSEPPAC
jgi:hypothetical protein